MTSKLTSPRATSIDDYIRAIPTSKVEGRREIYSLDGQRRELDVLRLPLAKLYFNIKNGRFAAQLAELEARERRHLDPTNRTDATKIETLLLSDADRTNWLKQDLKRVGQLQPGAITWDGAIINGNRRFAVLSSLHRETGQEEFGYFETVRLPRNLSSKDLWRIEAGLQLAVDLTEAYGPVNELLKIKEGLGYGLSTKEIAVTLGGDNTPATVKSKIERLTLIEDYLNYIGRSKAYSDVGRKVEHFINLQKLMNTARWKTFTAQRRTRVIHTAYRLIQSNVSHFEIRKLNKLADDEPLFSKLDAKLVKLIPPPTGYVERDEPLVKTSVPDQIRLLERTLAEPTKSDWASSTEEEDGEDDEDERTGGPDSTSQPALKAEVTEALHEIVDQLELKKRTNRPRFLVRRVESNLASLLELSPTELKSVETELVRLQDLVSRVLRRVST